MSTWAKETTLARLSFEEKIGQLCVLRIDFPRAAANFSQLEEAIIRYKPGAIILLSKSTIDQQCEYKRRLQAISPLPLIVWRKWSGAPSMRLIHGFRFPRAMTLGAIANDALIVEVGKADTLLQHKLSITGVILTGHNRARSYVIYVP